MHSALVELQERGLIKQCTDIEVLSKLLQEGSSVYCGFDPTADSLHIGSLLPLTILNVFSKHGVKVIALIGGATGSIGDPSFKAEERKMLGWENIFDNVAGIKSVIKNFLNNENVQIVDNYSWSKDISMLDFLRDYGKFFSVNSMINKESVRSRIERPEQGISFTEFSYQILQGMDFEYLFSEQNCKIQIGGSDQWGNMISGIDLIHKMHGNDAECGVITIPLVTKSDGTKFGKSESGTIWLTDKHTTAFNFYQFWRNIDDAEIPKLFKYFKPTDITFEEFEHNHLMNPNAVKKEFAFNMTKIVHGVSKAEQAAMISNFLFNSTTQVLSNDAIDMMIQSGFKVHECDHLDILSVLIESGLTSSKKMAREYITNGAVKINGRKVNEFYNSKENILTEELNNTSILQRGKNEFVVLKIK